MPILFKVPALLTPAIYTYFPDGDMGYHQTVETSYMKQKHRMIWERRHGKIGSGVNPDWKPAQKVSEE